MTAQYYQPLPSYSSKTFDLDFNTGDFTTRITMQMKVHMVTTSALPHTHEFLVNHFPQVLNTRCFNDKNLPFCEEVKDTEIAHLFEHILLQYLYSEKSSRGYTNVVFNGRTYWNWNRDPHGNFKIMIDAGKLDLPWLSTSVKKSIALMESLFETTQNTGRSLDLPVHHRI
jgi:hypothetical protein